MIKIKRAVVEWPTISLWKKVWWKLTHLFEESHINWYNETLMKVKIPIYPIFD